MKKEEQKLEIRNQWLAGWNYGRFGKEKLTDQFDEWYKGYEVGFKERANKKPPKRLPKELREIM